TSILQVTVAVAADARLKQSCEQGRAVIGQGRATHARRRSCARFPYHLGYRRHHHAYGWWRYGAYSPFYLPVRYGSLTVKVDPAEPPDYIVTINDRSYPAGRSDFRIAEGQATVFVTRDGKECRRTLRVTRAGPNTISCRL